MDVFVGRDAELAHALKTLASLTQNDLSAGEGLVWDIVGMNGVGKSMFLERVRAQAYQAIGSNLVVIAEDMTRQLPDIGLRGDFGADASAAALQRAFERSCELMRGCADLFREACGEPSFAEFFPVCHSVQAHARRFFNAHDVPGQRPAGGDTAVRDQIREFQRTVDDAFLDSWERLPPRPVLITLDPFDDFVDDQLGQWLIDIGLRLPNTLTMLARVPSPSAALPEHSRITRQTFAPFTIDQVRSFLARRFVGVDLGPEIATILHFYTDGHPGGLELAARLIAERGTGIEPVALRRTLDRLPDDDGKWATLVDLIVKAVHDPILVRAVDAAAVTRWFDGPLLGHLLELGDDPGSAAKALSALNEVGLIEPVGGGTQDRYRMVEFIRLSRAKKLHKEHRAESLHRLAAEYYLSLLQGDDEPAFGGATYGQWYRYENPRWQSDKRQWLYHSSQLADNRTFTRAMFVLVFLEAFYWWGCYYDFGFNSRLLEDWDRAAAARTGVDPGERAKDQQLADALSYFLQNYPVGPAKPASAPWDEMADGLRTASTLCGLESKLSTTLTRDERRHVAQCRALVRIFLAHTRRFRDPGDPKALGYYREALGLFEKLKDEWLACWMLFEIADLALERGLAAEAARLVEESAARTLAMYTDEAPDDEPTEDDDEFGLGVDSYRVLDKWDFELLANLHRARADAYWAAGDLPSAGAEYGRAVDHAYWFQGDPHPPDEYTQQFYVEIRGRAVDRIAALRDQGADRVARFAQAMVAELPAADEQEHLPVDGQHDTGADMFPAAPLTSELRSNVTDFMSRQADPAEGLRRLVPDAEAC